MSGRKTFLILSIEMKSSDSCFYDIILTVLFRIDGKKVKGTSMEPNWIVITVI